MKTLFFSWLRMLRARRALVLAALGLVCAGALPAAAQFFPFGGPRFERPPPPPNWPFEPFRRRQAEPERQVDYSRAPAPKKTETPPERSVLVLGDSMADWLAYGLEDAFAETPEIGVVRRIKTVSGLIQYERRGTPADWIEAARDIVPKEKVDAVVIMLGLHDRREIEEVVVEKKPGAAGEGAEKPGEPGQTNQAGQANQNTPANDDDADDGPDAIIAPEPRPNLKTGSHEFRSEGWVALYRKKIADMIAVAKASNAPVIWVGLPAVRGRRSTSDMSFLGSLFREEASKAGITFVDVWDGFVDESGRFTTYGADFEGQRRRLRSGDGVYFTKAGARKLAHYAEREIRRVLASRAAPVALPVDPGTPDLAVRPGGPPQRPLAGPIMPLVAASVGTEQLLGGSGTAPAPIDALAARTLVKGEALIPPAGRADDFVWPRRDFGSVGAGGAEPAPPIAAEDPPPVAAVDPAGTNARRPASSGAANDAPPQRPVAAANDNGLRPPGAVGAGAAPGGRPPGRPSGPLPNPFSVLERLFGGR